MTAPEPASGQDGATGMVPHALRAGVVAGLAYVLVGARPLLVPSLIRFVAPAYGRDDGGLATYFLVTALAYGLGSLFGGRIIRATGPRVALPAALAVMAAMLLVQGAAGTWEVFLGAGFASCIGASVADVGLNALVLDLFPHARGRAMNLLHVAFGVGALAAPLAISVGVGAGLAWPLAITVTGLLVLVAAAALAWTVPPNRLLPPAPRHASPPATPRAGPGGATTTERPARRLSRFLLAMLLAMGCYVAAEAGTSDWLVRRLDALPLSEASLALTLLWGGVVVGRLAYARFGTRLDPQRTVPLLAFAGGTILLVALVAPVSGASLALFGAVGVAFGPIFPLGVAIAGARMPGRSAMVTGALITASVVGATTVPPAIGFVAGAVGLPTAMLAAVAMAFLSAGAFAVARRLPA